MDNLCLSHDITIYLEGELVKDDSQNYTIDQNKVLKNSPREGMVFEENLLDAFRHKMIFTVKKDIKYFMKDTI